MFYDAGVDRYTALADPTRRAILEILAREGGLASTEIASRFDVSAPAISQHLKALREADLVRVEKRAQQRIYRLNPQAMLDFEHWARRLRNNWNQKLDALDALLKAEDDNSAGES